MIVYNSDLNFDGFMIDGELDIEEWLDYLLAIADLYNVQREE